MVKSFDIKLNDLPYRFADSPGIQLGAALTEPGRPSEVGSIVIASLHGGIGRGFDTGVLQYSSATEADLTTPGTFLPGYPTIAVGNFTASNLSIMRPAFGFGNGGRTVYVLAGQTFRTFDPSAPGSGLTTGTFTGDAFPASSELSGSVFQYNGQLVFGIILNSSGNEGIPTAYGVLTEGGTAITIDDAIGISYGASTRARAFWIEEVTIDCASSIGLRWAPTVFGATFKGASPYIEKPTAGTPGIDLGLPMPSWLTMVGSALLIMRQDGAIIGSDETGLLSVMGNTPMNGLEVNFGHRASTYHDGILIPSRNGLWSFNAQSLTMRPASPNYIQGEPIERMRGEVMAANGIGPYGFVALRQVSSAGTITSRAYEIVRYSDRIAVHDLIPETAANEVIVDFFPYYDSTTRRTLLYYLVHNESTDDVAVRYKPLRLPSDQHQAATGISSGSAVALPGLAGPSPASSMTKLFTQIRGSFNGGSSGTAHIDFTGFTVDGAAVTLATITADGPFAVPFLGTATNRIGRELTAGTITLDDPVIDSRIDLPLTVDFIWVPSAEDALTIKVLVSGEVQGRIASLWRRAPWGEAKALLALRNTVTTLEFPEGDDWTVFIEGVSIEDVKSPDGVGQHQRVATVQMRRLV